MAIRLGRFEMPKRVVKDEAASTATYGKFGRQRRGRFHRHLRQIHRGTL